MAPETQGLLGDPHLLCLIVSSLLVILKLFHSAFANGSKEETAEMFPRMHRVGTIKTFSAFHYLFSALLTLLVVTLSDSSISSRTSVTQGLMQHRPGIC